MEHGTSDRTPERVDARGRAERSDPCERDARAGGKPVRVYTRPSLLVFGQLALITANGGPRGRRDRTSRKTGF